MDTTDATAEGLAVAALDLARRFHAGATLWCLSPRWPSHARHLSVEFVHPVIVGTRALPARSVEGPIRRRRSDSCPAPGTCSSGWDRPTTR